MYLLRIGICTSVPQMTSLAINLWPVFIYPICFLLVFITSLIQFVDMIKGLPNRVVLSNAQVNYKGKNAVSQNSHWFIDIHLLICHLTV